jgi:hypothetical protein
MSHACPFVGPCGPVLIPNWDNFPFCFGKILLNAYVRGLRVPRSILLELPAGRKDDIPVIVGQKWEVSGIFGIVVKMSTAKK